MMQLFKQNAIAATPPGMSGILGRVMAILRTVKFSKRPRALQLRETLALGERRHLLIVEWESRSYLLGSTPQGIAILDRQQKCGLPEEAER